MRRHETPGEARYLPFSCYRRLPLLQNDLIKQAFVDRLALVRQTTPFALLAWVIMPEHLHLLVLPELPQHPVSKIMSALKRPFAEQVIRRWRELDAPILKKLLDAEGQTHLWQAGGGYDRNLYSGGEIAEKIHYIHANPIRRGLVKTAAHWPWSSARWYDGFRDGEVPIDWHL